MKKKGVIWIIVVVVILIVVWVAGTYNSFVKLNLQADNQWAQVQTQYQRRVDLIPNLVESVKGVMTQEQKIFGDLADARTRYGQATTPNDKATAASGVESALGRLLVVLENYPTLKSSENVQSLMTQLEGTENRVSVERQRFNNTVGAYNLKVKTIPSRWLAGMFGFAPRSFFEAQAGADKVPVVNLDLTK